MKLKTHKGASKRFKKTKKKKLKYRACGRGHLLTSKTSSRKRSLRKNRVVKSAGLEKNVKEQLPYS